jgi:hypothetical protein
MPEIHDTPSYFFEVHFNIVDHLRLGLQSGLFPEDKLPLKPNLAGVKHRTVFAE